jgi:hypothetical protein
MSGKWIATVCALGTSLFVSTETAVFAQTPGPIPGWYDADIGVVGQPGSSSQSDDTFRVSGAGSDIWGYADSFHFTFTNMAGDGDIAVLVRSESATHPFAKAGVMLRQSLDPSSPTVIFDVKPDGGTELMMRSFAGYQMLFETGSTGSFPVWLHLTRIGQHIAAFTSSQSCSMGCSDWTMVSRGWIPWVAGPAFMGLAVTSHDTSTVNDAVLDFWAAKTLDAAWQQTDVYTPAHLDFASSGNPAFGGQPGLFVVPGAGTDIWGTADSFKYVWQDVMPGDATLIARVVANQHPHPYAKAGVMMRVFANPSVASVVLDVKPDGGVEFMMRPSYGAETEFVAGGALALPGWLKLVKTGDRFTGYTSTDGASWLAIGTTTASLSPNGAAFNAGLATTAHDSSAPPTEVAIFDNVSLSAATPSNLLYEAGFEGYDPPELGTPGWASDRQIAAVSETLEPRTGLRNGACRSTTYQDCGIYQDVVAPTSAYYIVTFYANADRPGALVGANVNGTAVGRANVEARGRGNYGAPYGFGFTANAGDTIRLWMYSPATPGSAVIDDVVLAPYWGPR